MGKKKDGSLGIIGVVIAAIIAGIAAIPKELWILIGVVAAAYIAYRLFAPNASKAAIAQLPENDAPVSGPRATLRASEAGSYRIPQRPASLVADAKWIRPDEHIVVAGLPIQGGMLYIGKSLPSSNGYTDPALIDITKPVANGWVDIGARQMGYWPSYSEANPTARWAYLNWLSGGRSDPKADVGYVFLYFYGLERRVLVDGASDPTVAAELPLIEAEVRRLLEIYGQSSKSVRNYFSRFLEMILVPSNVKPLYLSPVPQIPRSYELPFYLRLALGQTAVDKVPVPAHLALAWADHDPIISKRTSITRCPEQYQAIFPAKYRQVCGEGIRLPINRTKLKLVYQPASAGFRGAGEISRRFGDIPDITSLITVSRNLQAVVDACASDLDGYSRYIRKNPDKAEALEGILQLPTAIWPQSAKDALEAVAQRMGGGMVVLQLEELTALLKAGTDLTRERLLGFARALESMNIGLEPDILGGAKLPKPADKIVLFAMQPGDPQSKGGPGFNAALVMLELATAVAHADGEFSSAEMVHLSKQIEGWQHLTPAHQRRLKAHLRLLIVAPVPLSAVKKKLEPLELSSRSAIAAFVASVAQLDGVVTQAEVKTLEKIYATLELPAKQLYSDLHIAATEDAPTAAKQLTKPPTADSGFVLDPGRIAALQRESEKVTAILANIFVDDTTQLPKAVVPEPAEEENEPTASSNLLDLDAAHSAFVRMIISRPHWTRSELEDVAGDLELMLDGALERVNEAAFDNFDIPLTQGDDPIEINPEILEKIEK